MESLNSTAFCYNPFDQNLQVTMGEFDDERCHQIKIFADKIVVHIDYEVAAVGVVAYAFEKTTIEQTTAVDYYKHECH